MLQQYGPGEWVWSYNAWQIEVTAVSVTAANTLGSHPGLMNRPPCQTTNPVNCATGNFTHTFTDLAVPGRGLALNLTRTYNSLAASTQGMFGYGWTSSYETSLSFDGNGNATVHQDEGAQATFFANGSGFTAPPQVLGTLGRNSDGTYTLTQRGKTQYKFSSSGQLLSESDLNGYTTAMAYNGAGRLSTVTDPAGRTLTFSYGSNGSVASVVDNAGRTVSYGYDGSGNLTGVTDAKGGLTSFGYDANHLLTSMTDPRNDGSLTNTYDSQGRVIDELDPLGRKTLFAYGSPSSSGSWTTTMTSPNGNVTSENYTDGILTSLTKGYGTSSAATWTYGYDQTLGVSSTTDPDGHVWTAGYDLNGNQLWSRDPPVNTTVSTYNGFDEPTAVTDPSGITTTYSYDANGNLLSVARPLTSTGQTQTTTYGYTDSSHPGNVTSITDPNGNVSTMTYDSYGDMASNTRPIRRPDDIQLQLYRRGFSRLLLKHRSSVFAGQPARQRGR